MEKRTVVKVNFSCLRLSRTIRTETTQTAQREVQYSYARNILNYTQSNVLVAGQSIVRTEDSEVFSSPLQEQAPPVDSAKRDEFDKKSIILSSDDEDSDKNDTQEVLFGENNNKYYHQCNPDDGALSDASTVPGAVHACKLYDCPSPEDIQMPEITSTEPVNIVEYSPSLDVEDQSHYKTEASSTGERRSSGKPTIIANEVCPQKVLVYREPVIKDFDETSNDFLGFNSPEKEESTLRNLRFVEVENKAEKLTTATEGKIGDVLSISTSSTESKDLFGSPARFAPIFPERFSARRLDLTTFKNLLNFQDLNNTVETDPIVYKFPGMIRDTCVDERSESPDSFSYLRNDLPNQVEPFATAVPTIYIVRSSLVNPISEPKGSGYSVLNPIFMKLSIKNPAELKKLKRKLKNMRRQLSHKQKLKFEKKSSNSSPVNSIATESVLNTPRTRSKAAELRKLKRLKNGHRQLSRKQKRMLEKKSSESSPVKSVATELALNSPRTRSKAAEIIGRRKRRANLRDADSPEKLIMDQGPRNQHLTRSFTRSLNSVEHPRQARLSLKEVRIILPPLEYSSFKKNFENERQTPDSNFNSSLVLETNVSSCDFEEYEHLKLSDSISFRDSNDDSHSGDEKSLEEGRSLGWNTYSPEETIKVRSSVRTRKSAEMSSPRAILRSRTSQLRKVSKKVTFSPDITLYYIKKDDRLFKQYS